MLAQAGLGSRRAMERCIEEGRVTVNERVAGVGTRVTSRDVVKMDQRVVRWPRVHRLPLVLIYHKPEGEMTSRDDPENRTARILQRIDELGIDVAIINTRPEFSAKIDVDLARGLDARFPRSGILGRYRVGWR